MERNMAEGIDPYKKWLGIPPKHQPPHHYRLLGLELYENDPDTIDNAAERQMAHVRKYQTGKHVELSQKLLNEIASARVCLLDPAKKALYDENLKVKLEKESPDALPMAEAIFDDDVAASASGKLSVARPAPPHAAPPRRPPSRPAPSVSNAAPAAAAAAPPAKRAPAKAASGATAAAAASGAAGAAGDKTPAAKGGFPLWIPLVIGGAGLAAVLLMVGIILAVAGVFSSDDDARDRVAKKKTVRPKETDEPKPPYGKKHGPFGKSHDNGKPKGTDDGPTDIVEPGGGNPGDDPGDDPGDAPGDDPGDDPGDAPGDDPGGDPGDDPPPIMSAYVYVTGECNDGYLREGEQAVAEPRMVFSDLGEELERLRFTRFNRGGVTDVTAEVRSSGTVFLIVRPEFTSQFEKSSKWPEFRKTSITCEIRDSRYRRIQYDVLMGNFMLGRELKVALETDTPGDLPFLLAARRMTVRPPPPPPPPELAAIPSPDAQAKIVLKVNELFDPEQAKTPADRRKIGQKLIAAGTESSDNPNDAFVMLRMGHDLAAGVADLKTAFGAIDRIEERFKDADVVAMRLRSVSLALKVLLPPAQKRVLLEQALPVIDEALDAEKCKEAKKVLEALRRVASPLRDAADLKKALADRFKQITAYEKVEPSLKKLKTNPDDPDANATAGRYYCFVREEWDKGLPMLAKSADEQMKKLAAADLAKPDEPEEQMKVAEGWYDLSNKKPGSEKVVLSASEKVALLGRAEHWYTQSVPKLTGLNKVQGEKHLGEVRKRIEAAGGSKRFVWPRKATIVAATDYNFEMYLNGNYMTSGSSSSITRRDVTFNKGDVIIVRVYRSKSYSYGPRAAFACVIKFADSSRYVTTGMAGSPWQSYQPKSTSSSYWYRPGEGKVIGSPLAVPGTAPQRIYQATRAQCGAIWGRYDTAPSSSYGHTFLVLQIK